jgi:flagellar assembly protein FliH
MSRSPVLRGKTADAVSVLYTEEMVVGERQLLTLKDQARVEGYQAGLEAAGAETARLAERARADVASALQALALATTQAVAAIQREQRHLEAAACDLSFGIAEAILDREIALAIDPGRDAVLRALAEVPTENGPITIRLNPADIATLRQPDVIAEGTKVVPDPTIERGGCVLEVGAAMIDARVETALQRVRKILDRATATP